MRDRFILPALIISSVFASCVASTEDYDINVELPEVAESTSVSSGKSITPVNSHIRIQVSEDLSAVLLESPNHNSLVGTNGIKSVQPTFYIGGKWEKVQREAGLHTWFDVELSPLTKSVDVSQIPGIIDAEPFYEIQSTVQFNDPKLSSQWHYNNTGSGVFRAGADMRLQAAWDRYGKFGNNSVIIAVNDSGIDVEHEDLHDNIWVNEAELNGQAGVDDDKNGYVDDIYGYNFASRTGTMHPESHGTHVAGTVAAVNNNGIGVAGVAGGNYPQQGVRIMAIQSMDGDANSSDPVREFQYAAENGAVIISNSWGYPEATKLPSVTKTAIDYFIDHAGMDENGNQIGMMKGGLVVFAAGNESRTTHYPAQYSRVMAVAAIGPSGLAANYTNYGEWVDVSAPGGDVSIDRTKGGVYSTLPGNKYGSMQGTSMACPHVGGLAALLVSEFGGPGFTNTRLWDIIVGSCDPFIYDLNPSMKGLLGAGMVDALKAMGSFSTKAPEKPTIISATAKSNFITVNTTVPADVDDGYASFFNVRIAGKTYRVPCAESFTLSGFEFNKEYSISMTALDLAGNESAVSNTVKVRTGSNNAPQFTASAPTTGVKIIQWEERNWSVDIVDPDGHRFEAEIEGDTGIALFKINDSKVRVQIRGMLSAIGSHKASLIAVDEFGAKSTLEFDYTVNKNHAPVMLSKPDNLSFNAEETATLDLSKNVYDEDGETLAVRVNAPDGLKYQILPDMKVSFTSPHVGLYDVNVTVIDGALESASADIQVLVRDSSVACDIYPNPVVDNLYLRTGSNGQNVTAKVSSASGKVVLEATGTSGPFNPMALDVRSLAPGRYSVEATVGSEIVKTVVVKK